jgi:hypothetical protein
MQEKLNQLSLGEKLVAGGGIVMLIASLFDWWHYSSGPFSYGQSGWGDPGSIWSVLAILISIVLAGIVLAVRFGNVNMPALPAGWTWGMVYGAGAALVVLLMLLKFWRIMAVPAGGPGLGFFLAALATAAIAYGGFVLYNSDKGAGFQSLMNKKQ